MSGLEFNEKAAIVNTPAIDNKSTTRIEAEVIALLYPTRDNSQNRLLQFHDR